MLIGLWKPGILGGIWRELWVQNSTGQVWKMNRGGMTSALTSYLWFRNSLSLIGKNNLPLVNWRILTYQWDHLLFRSHCPSQPSFYFCSYKTFLSQSTWQKDKMWNRMSSRAWPPHKVRTIYPVTQRAGDESGQAEGPLFPPGWFRTSVRWPLPPTLVGNQADSIRSE